MTVARARTLRRNATMPEQQLWRRLRASQLNGLKFRRQTPIGPYIMDFFAPSAWLVVEVDGITHVGTPADRERDAWLSGEGYRVPRVWNNEVMENLDGVLQLIQQAARGENPSPNPLPQGERAPPSPSPLGGEGRGEG
ncbi:MAG: endonuclease domain-containing protein [Acetobacteraceae bacterium]|nr:endonuclease domain-containing protein [Acetobacteraceae bacterium]